MKLPVTCSECNREGTFFPEHGVVVHNVSDTVCVMPPRVENPKVVVDRYSSPWKMRLRG